MRGGMRVTKLSRQGEIRVHAAREKVVGASIAE